MQPVIFLQGNEAYDIIDLDDKDRDIMIKSLMEYLPDVLPEPENIEPENLNYRIVFTHNEGDRKYTIGYTTGDGGCVGVYLAK